MSRYIDAEELIFIGLDNPDDDHLFEFVPREFIDNAPTADVVKVVHGEWVQSKIIEEVYNCSVCGGSCWYYDVDGYLGRSKYCPNCGARMDGEK